MVSLLRQPIIHFMAIAGGIFVLFQLLNPAAESKDRIVIDESRLEEYMQYRSRRFDPEEASAVLEEMSREQREALVTKVVKEEVLYREALRLGLERSDYIIKQRLVQKMEYLNRGFDSARTAPTPAQVREFHRHNLGRYRQAATATFQHIFIGDKGADPAAALPRAQALQQRLNSGPEIANTAPVTGDRFPYHLNYVERTRELVASHFGEPFARKLFTLPADAGRWQGPLWSEHGVHLVRVLETRQERQPDLDEIYQQVTEDTRRWLADKQADKSTERLVRQYRIEVSPGLMAQPAASKGDSDARVAQGD